MENQDVGKISVADIFEAMQKKIRFETPKGTLGLEDLFSLPLVSTKSFSLDNLAKSLYEELRVTRVSFVSMGSIGCNDTETERKLNLVVAVINYRQDLITKQQQRNVLTARVSELESLLYKKQQESLTGKSQDELQSEIAALKKQLFN